MTEQEKRAWFFACTGRVASTNMALYNFFLEGAAHEREECKRICREVAGRYPTDIFPDYGQSLDCKSARMARLTAANIEREIADRSRQNPVDGPSNWRSGMFLTAW
jgi:hypothetical protein